MASEPPPAVPTAARWRIRPVAALAALFGAVLALSACSGSSETTASETASRTFDTTAAPKLVAETFNGLIEVTAAKGNTVTVTVTRVGEGSSDSSARRDLQNISVSIVQEGETVRVMAARSGDNTHPGRSEARFTISVPPGTSADLNSTNGEIHVSGVSGGVRAATANGAIRTDSVTGQVYARSKDGAIAIAGENVLADARTENGEVSFSGSLAEGVHQLRTSNGAIVVSLPPAAAFRLEASTINGTVTCDFKLSGADTSAKTSLSGTTVPGAKTTLSLHTNNGNITIR